MKSMEHTTLCHPYRTRSLQDSPSTSLSPRPLTGHLRLLLVIISQLPLPPPPLLMGCWGGVGGGVLPPTELCVCPQPDAGGGGTQKQVWFMK